MAHGADDEWLPYEQQPDEASRQFEHFRCYRDLGPLRTLRRAAADAGVDYAYLRGLSADRGWQARARAWDLEMDRARRAGLLERQRSVLDEHRELARAMREKARAAVANTHELDPDEVARWVRCATQIEHTVYNIPDGATASDARTPAELYLSSLSDLKLMRLVHEAQKVLEKEIADADPDPTGTRFTAAPRSPAD